MRKQSRTAAQVIATAVGAGVMLAQLFSGSIPAMANEDRTDSETYTEARSDYWEARAAYEARKAATQARKAGIVLGEEEAAASEEEGESEEGVAAGPAAGGYPTNSQLAALRMCESSDNYYANTGNGYYGAYQFSPITWWWIGYTGYPHQASPAVQDQAVRDLYARMGWSPWPSCARYLGFL